MRILPSYLNTNKFNIDALPGCLTENAAKSVGKCIIGNMVYFNDATYIPYFNVIYNNKIKPFDNIVIVGNIPEEVNDSYTFIKELCCESFQFDIECLDIPDMESVYTINNANNRFTTITVAYNELGRTTEYMKKMEDLFKRDENIISRELALNFI